MAKSQLRLHGRPTIFSVMGREGLPKFTAVRYTEVPNLHTSRGRDSLRGYDVSNLEV